MRSRAESGAKRLALDAALLGAALLLSYLESFIPLPLAGAVPGIKLGFANIAVILCAYLISMPDAAALSLCRIVISAVLFGSVTSLWFSLAGGAAALAVLAVIIYSPLRNHISPIGASVACAAAHNAGQLSAACFVFGSADILRYLPALLISAVIFGSITGVIAGRVITAAGSIKR